MKWFRWYRGSCEDGKLRYVARESRVTIRDVIAVWALLLEDAARTDHRGVCLYSRAYMEAVLDFDDGALLCVLEAMQNASLIEIESHQINVCNFKERQFDSDADGTAKQRQRNKRKRDKFNGTVTHPSVTRDRDGPDTDTDTDTDKDKSLPQKKERRKNEWPTDYVDQFWREYPRRVGKGAAAKKLRAIYAADNVAWDLLIAAVRLYAKEVKGNDPKYTAHPATWLNQGRWEDELPGGTKIFAPGPPKGSPANPWTSKEEYLEFKRLEDLKVLESLRCRND